MTLSISVVIPLYNHEAYIANTLLSVFAQTVRPNEVIVIDDGSQDGGGEIVRQMQRSRPELIFWRHPNRGAHNTINAGIARASGDLIAILNSDDIYAPERLQAARQAFEEKPELDVVATRLSFIDQHGAAIPNAWYDESMAFFQSCGDAGLGLVNANVLMTTSNLVVRRRVFDSLGSFSNLRYCHDIDFILRMVAYDRPMTIINRPLIKYRMHTTNTISEGALKVKAEWAVVTAFYLAKLALRANGAQEISKYIPTLVRHTLLEAAMFLVPYFITNPSMTLEVSPYHQDAAVQRQLREIIGS